MTRSKSNCLLGKQFFITSQLTVATAYKKEEKKTNEKTNKQKKRWNWVSTPILLKPNLNEFDQFSIVICQELTDSI